MGAGGYLMARQSLPAIVATDDARRICRARPAFPSAIAWNGVPWICLATTVAIAALQPAFLAAGSVYVWVISILVLGLPHGACDPLVLSRLRPGRWAWRDRATFYLLYLAAAGLVVLLWVANPRAGLLFFLALTTWHWGSADAVARDSRGAWYIAGSLARGAIVVLAPVVFHPTESAAMFARLVAIAAPAQAHAFSLSSSVVAAARVAVAAGVAVECVHVARAARRGRPGRAAAGCVDLALLLALYLTAPPVTAVGLYFVAWHSWRHILRVGALLDGRRVSAGRLVVRYYELAWPLTLVSIAGLIAVTLAIRPRGLPQLIAVYLVLISALTLPHAVVVALCDRDAQFIAWRSDQVGSR